MSSSSRVVSSTLFLPLSTLFAEEFLKEFMTFGRKDVRHDLAKMVQTCIFQKSVEGTNRPGLVVGRTVNNAPDPGRKDCPGAHRTRFHRNEKFGIFDSPGRIEGRGTPNGKNLGMGGRVAIGLFSIMRLGDHLTGANNDRTDRHFSLFGRETGLGYRFAHQKEISLARHLGGSWIDSVGRKSFLRQKAT